jgi:hypothetical protein
MKFLLEGMASDKDVHKKLRDENGTLNEKTRILELQLEESKSSEAMLREQLTRMEEISKLVEARGSSRTIFRI